MTKLDKPVRREINVDGMAYTLTIDPLGLQLVEKGHRNGIGLTWRSLLNGDAAIAAALQASTQIQANSDILRTETLVSRTDYLRKRDLSRFGEPDFDGSIAASRSIFVVQLHHASSRHFDFRLQVCDVLKSWAVPKGPSFDPKLKRLAIEVEDHPVAYADFEGDIEEGYGKGHVDLFDRGVWTTQREALPQLEKGHLRFELFGEKLKGAWHLVRSSRKQRQPAWFLIKDKDRYSGDREANDLLDEKSIESTRRAARTPKERAIARKAAANKAKRQNASSRHLPSLALKPSRLTGAR